MKWKFIFKRNLTPLHSNRKLRRGRSFGSFPFQIQISPLLCRILAPSSVLVLTCDISLDGGGVSCNYHNSSSWNSSGSPDKLNFLEGVYAFALWKSGKGFTNPTFSGFPANYVVSHWRHKERRLPGKLQTSIWWWCGVPQLILTIPLIRRRMNRAWQCKRRVCVCSSDNL